MNFFLWSSLRRDAQRVFSKFHQSGQTLAFAESCTGGLAAATLTAIPGASSFFLGSLVVYSNQLKEDVLGVPLEVLETHGAVSEQTVQEMAEQLRKKTGADLCAGITGIAGPTGATQDKPLGLVWFSLTDQEGTSTWHRIFSGNRKRVQIMSSREIFKSLCEGPPVDSRRIRFYA